MRVLLTGARAPATLELARLCARAGHEVHVADTHAWHVCRGSRLIAASHRLPAPRQGRAAYGVAVRGLVMRHRIDVIIPTCEEVFHLAALADDTGAPVRCEPLDRLAPLHDKWRFIAAVRDAGIAAPRTHQVDSWETLRTLPDGRYVIKPRYSRFATRVFTWASGDALPERSGATGAWIAQELLEGTAYCTWSVVVRGRLTAHVTYAPDATAGPRGAAIAFHSVHHAGVQEWVRCFVAYHALSGQFAFDLFDTARGVQAIECNPRLTSGIHCFRGMPGVVDGLVHPERAAQAPVSEPSAGRAFSSRLAETLYRQPRSGGAGLLDDREDPWPARLQPITWAHLLVRAGLARQDPRAWSTHDIEWNGE